MIKLRDYQEGSVKSAWESCRNGKNPVIVLPTGAGKSLVIAQLVKEAVSWGGRIVILAHRKELLEQNAAEIEKLCQVKVGVYSAGLKRRDTDEAVIVAGIQSIYKYAFDLGQRHIVLIDEAHLIPPDSSTMYGRFLTDIRACNEKVFTIGLTATPYRTGGGCIVEHLGIFDEICYEAQVGDLIERGYLSRLTNSPSVEGVDTSRLKVRMGEYVAKDMELLFIETANAAVNEMVHLASDRKSIIVFTAGVDHAELVAESIGKITGEAVAVVTGGTGSKEREDSIRQFKAGQVRWLVNVNVLTTGFNATRTDTVAVMRATTSAGLFAQMVGRGLRLHEGKEDCLILDYGGNLERHGCLDDPDYGRKPPAEKSKVSAKDSRTCPQCSTAVPKESVYCQECYHVFTPEERERSISHDTNADKSKPILLKDLPCMKEEPNGTYSVKGVSWARNFGRNGKQDTLRVTYTLYPRIDGVDKLDESFDINEWVCIEHEGWGRKRAKAFWEEHIDYAFQSKISTCLFFKDEEWARMPKEITIKRRGNFWDIKNRNFDGIEYPKVDYKPYSDDEIPF
jgi:DNA repair protein RadD